jgi:exopolyphosphatase/guanosine-5'-triphosphate,3'-diphosphate pyrophosphatase
MEDSTSQTSPAGQEALIAALDLGSNSFHMIVARIEGDHFHVVDRLREPVRLAAGLDDEGLLTPEVQVAALDAIARFGQRLRGMLSSNIKAVGTNALRQARNSERFLARARDALGHPIDIISGMEEARLIHCGVVSDMPHADKRHLVIDIGGGSTELIVGEASQAVSTTSLVMGCVNVTQRFFADGQLRAKSFTRAVLQAELELEPVKHTLLRLGWQQVFGASGTIRSIERTAVACGWSAQGITPTALEKLREAVLAAGSVQKLDLPGLAKDRVPVFAGGLAVLTALFESLHIDQMAVSDRALREGLLYDLMGRIHHEDVRESSVRLRMSRYGVDVGQAERVKKSALTLWDQVRALWDIAAEPYGQALAWAAQLHEVGLAVAHDDYHRHGAYIAEFSDLPGFTRQEQLLVAVLIRNHRRKFVPTTFEVLAEDQREQARKLAVILRLAVLFHRSRSADVDPPLKLAVDKKTVRLTLPEGWLTDHPLTQTDLEREQDYLKAAKIKLDFN